ncbi:lipoprotein [Melioribacter roseus P3M-2]|uniref:Lipoprotein n=1 Tax=Melioribacter roseus (strain DSM 23840 / JCM 17771 / VKM B-2668 / P3M-2) TaxID=1191523 RepID=I7A164_MELRP|nr:N-acetylmuramoyl-L-alanine amidase-like domain-containing protein [Melioribacter roseus]AFN74933.1 lipoprotein [Melioribacter roseus P3M-2]
MNKLNFLLLFLLLIIITFITNAQVYSPEDVAICRNKLELAYKNNLRSEPINKIIEQIGLSFIGADYKAHTLEETEDESLIINLKGLDCYTFVEATVALARCIKNNDTSFNAFLKEIENLRYRNGDMKGYASRLHYFSDWIYEMQKRGIGKDITEEIGGIPYNKKINFMSSHTKSYKQLADNRKLTDSIALIENEISSRKYYYIPQKMIRRIESKLLSGDIIGITTNIPGLDISHTGIAVKGRDGRIHLLHAPDVGKKVEITKLPLAEYIESHSKQTGIMVLRIN